MMPGKVLVVFLILNTCLAEWSATQVAQIARAIADERNLKCFAVCHPRKQQPLQVFPVVKALQPGRNLRLLRVLPFISSENNLHMCSQILYILLAWLPDARREFQRFATDTQINYPTWLVLLGSNDTPETFIGENYIPFPAHILTANQEANQITIKEIWRVTWGFALRTVPYAVWTPTAELNCTRIFCQYHPRNDLEGVPLRAATKDDMPLSELTFNNEGALAIGGYFGDIFYELAAQLNCTPVVIPATQNFTGFSHNGTWNGLIGMMTRNTTDLAVGPISVQSKIMNVADFVHPLLRTNYQVFFKQDGNVVEWDAFLKPFGKFVWRLILLWFLVSAFALNFFYRLGVVGQGENPIYLWEFSKLNSFLTFLRAFCQQGCHLLPRTLSCRGLYLTGYLTSSILLTAYSASLISKLTLQEPLRPFDSLETFLEDGSYALTAIAASTDYTYFSEASDGTLVAIYHRLMKSIPEDALPMGKEEGLSKVCDKTKTALFITFAVTQITAKQMEISRKCRILYFRKPLGTVFLTIGIRRNMPYSRLIANQVQVMAERGILRRLKQKEWPLKSYTSLYVASPQVEIQQVAQIHSILLAGIGLALIILAAEILSVHPKYAKHIKKLKRRYGITPDIATTCVFIFIAVVVIISLIISFQ